MKNLSLIFASTFDGGIGYKNVLPWHIPSEMRKFKEITCKVANPSKMNAVIMGRKTFEFLPKPLAKRINIVITRYNTEKSSSSNVVFVNSIEDALKYCEGNNIIESMFLIGGSILFESFFNNQYRCSKLYLSIVYDTSIKTDTYFDLSQIFKYFHLQKDINYQKESNEKLFASFVGIPLDQSYKNT